jgi:arsenate reductase-like glutaredoxin family protein
MGFWNRSEAQKATKARLKAEKKAASEKRVAEFSARLQAKAEHRNKARSTHAMQDLLQDGETLDGMFRTNELILKKHVLVTSRRLIVGFDAENTESIFYRHIAGLETSNFLAERDLSVAVAGRKEKLKLTFGKAEDRDQLRDLISARLVNN